jgi:hypothetical protein
MSARRWTKEKQMDVNAEHYKVAEIAARAAGDMLRTCKIGKVLPEWAHEQRP